MIACRRGGLAADDLDEGDEVRWVEGMADEDPLRVGAVALQLARAEAGRARGDQRRRFRGGVDVCEQLDLVAEPLGSILLDEVGGRDGVVDRGGEGQPIR